jgi:type II secretion system protein N
MRRALTVLAFAVWTVVVGYGTFRLTFPSDVIAERIRYEVPLRLGRAWSAEVGSVSPWWLGVSLADVKLFQGAAPALRYVPPAIAGDDEEGDLTAEPPQNPVTPGAEEGPQLAAALSNLSLRLSPMSLLYRAPYVIGSASFGDHELYGEFGTTIGARGEVHVEDLILDGEVPLAELLAAMVPGASGEGVLDLDVDIAGGERGMNDGSGQAGVRGTRLVLSDLEFPGIGPLGMDITISDLVLVTDVVNGRATVSDGKLVSDLATVSISGEFNLRDPLDRSAYDLQFVISDLSPQVSTFQGLMSGAKQSDGTFLYSCRGVLSRPTMSGCSSRPRSATARPPSATRPTTPGDIDERERKREEIRERLRKEREERQAGGAVTPPAVGAPEGDVPPEELGEEVLLDEGDLDEGEEEPPLE